MGGAQTQTERGPVSQLCCASLQGIQKKASQSASLAHVRPFCLCLLCLCWLQTHINKIAQTNGAQKKERKKEANERLKNAPRIYLQRWSQEKRPPRSLARRYIDSGLLATHQKHTTASFPDNDEVAFLAPASQRASEPIVCNASDWLVGF